MNDAAGSGATWRPRTSVALARRRAALLQSAREYFARENVLEVDTPAIGRYAVTDPQIESLAAGDGFLQTSPEYFMKRLLAHGYPDIYQISKVFRSGESGRRHLPEFTLIEWYRLGFSLPEIIRDTAAFIAHVSGNEAMLADLQSVSYTDALRAACGLDAHAATIAQLADAVAADETLRESLADDRDAWLDLVFADKVSSSFADDRLTCVFHYPASQAALARLCPEDDRVADRFEIFLGKLELCNGFVELLDAGEQHARFRRDQAKRVEQQKPLREIDERLISALRHGLPPCAGVAVGFDRLTMALTGSNDIATINTFPNEF